VNPQTTTPRCQSRHHRRQGEGQSGSTDFTFQPLRAPRPDHAVSAKWWGRRRGRPKAPIHRRRQPTGLVSFAAGESLEGRHHQCRRRQTNRRVNEAFSVTLSIPAPARSYGTLESASANGVIPQRRLPSLSIAPQRRQGGRPAGSSPFTFKPSNPHRRT
jgi:hypothetical protein